MEKNETKHYKASISGGILLIGTGLLLPIITQEAWFNIIFMIRKAINTGDSGHLILASASVNFLYSVQSTFLFLGAVLIIYYTDFKLLFDKFQISIISFLAVIFLHILNSIINCLLWQPISTILALIIVLIIFEKLLEETNSILHVFIVSIQVFFAFQWLNIMQTFPSNGIDQSDIFCSIRIASQYLSADSVLNFTGSAFFLTFTFSAFITTTLFISYSQNINMMKENYEKEKEIQIMKAKALENRIYKEVNSLVHDLKTPLVTIRGLNSLLAISKDQRKFLEYSEHIDSSVEKMN
jgi:signal transduction histidine kinase